MSIPAMESSAGARTGAPRPGRRLGIVLMGKGAMNHLHRQSVVDALRRRGLQIQFLVREDYIGLLERFPGVEYRACRVEPASPLTEYLRNHARYVRSLFPVREVGALMRHRVASSRGLAATLQYALARMLARSQSVLRILVTVESWLYREVRVEGLTPGDIDLLLLLGTGTFGTETEGTLTWWARFHKIPTLHCVGNYDSLSSKGFRGVPIQRLLVWGEAMQRDAIHLHAVRPECVAAIGAVRYDRVRAEIEPDKASFLRARGLDPAKPTVLFAGSTFEFHYFEILEVLRLLREKGADYQAIIRIYPNKILMASPFIPPLIAYAQSLPGVYVSVGDPNYASGAPQSEVLHIEEYELWNSLAWCDLVINLYSTMALEACVFDRPVINMWYFAKHDQRTLRPALVVDYPNYRHAKRMASYDAVSVAGSRAELQRMIVENLAHPELRKAQRAHAVLQECGVLDGHACERLAEECLTFQR